MINVSSEKYQTIESVMLFYVKTVRTEIVELYNIQKFK